MDDDLRPILEQWPDAPEAKLLGSAGLDRPPRGGAAHILAGLGAGAATSIAATAATAAAASGKASSVPIAGAALFTKWLSVGMVAGLAVAGAGTAVRDSLTESPPAAAVVSTNRAAAPRAAIESAPRLRDSVPSETVPERTVAPPPSRAFELDVTKTPIRQEPLASRPPDPSPIPSLAEEVRALDEARAAVARGDANAALRSLDAFDARFARPRLGPEATLLRVEALVVAGRTSEAERLGRWFLSTERDGTLTRRMTSLLESARRESGAR